MVFSSNRDASSEHRKLWIIRSDGTRLHRIANVIELSPTVLRDGRILFTDETVPTQSWFYNRHPKNA
jgi:hypothetical protein